MLSSYFYVTYLTWLKCFLQGERSGLRLMNSVEYMTGVSPYQLPVINNYMIPVPPPPLQKGDKSGNVGRTGVLRARQLRPITAPNLEQLLTKVSYLCLPLFALYLPNAKRCVYLCCITIHWIFERKFVTIKIYNFHPPPYILKPFWGKRCLNRKPHRNSHWWLSVVVNLMLHLSVSSPRTSEDYLKWVDQVHCICS